MVMSCGFASNFFNEFPEYSSVLAFLNLPESDTTKNLIAQVKKANPYFPVRALLAIDQNCCVTVPVGDQTFYFINIVENYDFWSNVSWPLLKMNDDAEILKDFIRDHEIAHALLSILRPHSYVSVNSLLSLSEDTNHKYFHEDFADCYAGLRCLQKQGIKGLKFIHKMADCRLLSAVKCGQSRHLTTVVLDALYQSYQDPEKMVELTTQSPQGTVQTALNLSTRYTQPSKEKSKSVSLWQQAIFSPSYETLAHASLSRLYSAIQRQVDVDEDTLDEFIESVGFEKGDLSKAFTRSSVLKAIVGLDISLVTAEDMKDVQEHLEEGLENRQKNWALCANRFPGLARFTQSVRGTFHGDRYALLSALASRSFGNNLSKEYLTRQALRRIAQAYEMHGN